MVVNCDDDDEEEVVVVMMTIIVIMHFHKTVSYTLRYQPMVLQIHLQKTRSIPEISQWKNSKK